MITVDYISDWASRLRTRLYTQFRNKTTWNAWIDNVLAPQFQDLEDAAQTLLGIVDIDNSQGAQLDVLGRIVGRQRNGDDDPTYRLHLKATIAANKSSGDPESLYTVFHALLGDIGFVITTSYIGVKAFVLK